MLAGAERCVRNGDGMIKRWIFVCALSASLVFAPTQPQAQVADVLLKCTKSMGVAFACLIIQSGVTKVVDIGLDNLIAYATGSREFDPDDAAPSKASIADVEANGVAWESLKEFLASLYKSEPKVDRGEARKKFGEACDAAYHPVCSQLGFIRPRENAFNCAKFTTRQDCDQAAYCSWQGNACGQYGSGHRLKEMLERGAAPAGR
jgi:hypothetical protein